jgi:pyruvate/2-oxoglutarate dehydrogenase complex dihydrolipoamide acyltransferase (E2) component
VVGGTVAERLPQRGASPTRAGAAGRWCPDGSLSGGENSGEIVSPVLGYDDIEELQNIIRAVRTAGAKADHSTGIHIHVGAAALRRQERGEPGEAGSQAGAPPRARARGQRAAPERATAARSKRASSSALEARRPKTMSDVRDAWYGRSGETPSATTAARYHGLNLNSLFFRGTMEFRYFNGTLHAGEVKAYVQLVLAMAAKALSSKAASSKRREFNPATAKYDFRVVLLHLGLIGDEFKTARLHLTKKLAGSAAWKGERRDRRPAATRSPASEEVGDARAAA